MAAQRFTWQATVDGEPVISAIVNWLMGDEHLDPAVDVRARGRALRGRGRGRPRRAGDVPRACTPTPSRRGSARNPGIVATAMHCVNAIPYVCAAEPGVRTYLDLPLIAGRARVR